MKLMAKRSRPRFLINRKKPYQTIKNKLNQRVNEKYPESNDR